jgi:CheY-like chemotaxis protein
MEGRGGDQERRTSDVLVVSPDEDARRIFALALEHGGYRVRVLAEPDAALATVLEQRPALVITNFPLPVAGGRTMTEVLRADPRTRTVPILNVMSHVTDRELASARAAGIDVSLPMPVELRTLIDAVRRLLAERSG